ncbi:MAG: phospholipase D-like domain-containing protein [Moheibacter sp.]
MKLILDKWSSTFEEQLSNANKVKIISPSFSMITMKILGRFNLIKETELITRYSLYDFFVKLSDIDALTYAVSDGMKVFGVKNLHCKTYIFNDEKAIISSSNFTWGGLFRNHECGILTDDIQIISELLAYFDKLKASAGEYLQIDDCEKWKSELLPVKEDILTPYMMPDYGKEVIT